MPIKEYKFMADGDPAGLLIILTLISSALISHFLAKVVASKRHRAGKVAIFVITLFLGWSLMGWAVALTWASKGISNYNYR
jgi:hypothetical protein